MRYFEGRRRPPIRRREGGRVSYDPIPEGADMPPLPDDHGWWINVDWTSFGVMVFFGRTLGVTVGPLCVMWIRRHPR